MRKTTELIVIAIPALICCCLATVVTATNVTTSYPTTEASGNDSGHGGHKGVHLVSWNFDYVAHPLAICLVILFAAVVKLGFHYASFLSSMVPESCVLIAIGTAMGAITHYGFNLTDIHLTPRTFLLFLLPPIVLEAAYSLNDRVFFQNIGSILIFAVIGTIINFVVIGPVLYGLALSGAMGEIQINIVQCLLFASFIVAVDPVAVLAIFNEVGVNSVLYFLVFGESLLNDAVTVVISSMMKAFNEMDTIPPSQIALGVGSFFTISLGGLAIGIVFGILTALVTRTTHHVRVVEPLAILLLAYMSYIVAELFHWSGIISMIGCGLVQAQYAFHNISHHSFITVEYFIKMLASVMDAVIFLFLGLELIRANHVWHTGFILWSLLLCLVVRFLVVFGLTFVLNRVDRVHPIKLEEQFIMWYGGLRGAVCFALVETINRNFEHKELFITCTFVIIMFTVFAQGVTIKPLVSLCQITRKAEDNTMLIEELQIQVNDHIMTGIEVIIDQAGQNVFRSWFSKMNDKYIRRLLQNDPMTQEQKILDVYRDLAVTDYRLALEGGAHYLKTTTEGEGAPDPQVPEHPAGTSQRLSTISAMSGIIAYDKSILRRRKPTSSSSSQRPSFLDHMTGRLQPDAEINSVSDFRRLLKGAGSGSGSLHKRYDPDIVREEERDFETRLQEQLQRISRFHAFQRNSILSSGMGSQQYLPQFPVHHGRVALDVHAVQRQSSSASSMSGMSDLSRPRVSYTPGNPDGQYDVNIELQNIRRQSSLQNGSNPS